MTNFIFKSHGTYKKSDIQLKLNLIQIELRHQRSEHADILRNIHKLLVDRNLTQQSLDYFQDKDIEDDAEDSSEHIPDKTNEE